MNETDTRRSGRNLKKLLAVSATTLIASMAIAIPASAIITSPPTTTLPVVFPERDFVAAEGYPANAPLTVEVWRNGVKIATASGTTDADGFLEVNHPGGVCWEGSTPNILPEDEVRFLTGPGDGDAVTTANVTATQASIVGSDVVVHGTASNVDGSRIPLNKIEQRIVQPAFRDTPGSRITRRDIRAVSPAEPIRDVPGTNASLRYDSPTSNNWTATYSGLNGVERDLAVAGQTRVLAWMAFTGGERRGVTIFEVGEVGGPGFGGCPLGSDFAVTNSNHKTVNASNVARNLVLSGVSQDATAVSVTLNDRNPATKALKATAVPAPGTGAQTWSVTFSSGVKPGVRGVSDLKDGMLTAKGTYTLAGGKVSGVNLSILKDTVAPRSPRATPKAGTYQRTQFVSLETGGNNKIYFTQSGSKPNLNSQVFRRQIRVSSTQTIKAIAVDPAGNKSAVESFRYVIR